MLLLTYLLTYLTA